MNTFFCDLNDPVLLIFSHSAPALLYYSHFPGIIISLALGLFIFLKNREFLVNKLLLFVFSSFSLWLFFDLILWTENDSRLVMFFWSLIILVETLVFAGSLYLTLVFLNERDISFLKKAVIFLMVLPVIVLAPTMLNIVGFDLTGCQSQEGFIAVNYVYALETVFSFWILIISVINYKKSQEPSQKKKILFFTLGLALFLFSFSWGNIIASFTLNWEWEQYGLFGMPVFAGLLAYIIVKYKAFHAKLLAAEALILSIVVIVGSQFFFIRSMTNRILTGITFALVITFGYMLIKSIRLEVRRKEELQIITDKLALANDQLRKLDNTKSEFISIASHQLRTPLTAIKGFISLVLEGSYGEVNSQVREALNKVYLSNERLISLVEDLLNLSRIESGRIEYEIGKVKIEDVAREVFETFLIKAKERKLKIEMNLPEKTLPEVETDRKKILEVISNLVDNAIKYTPKGWVKINLSSDNDLVRVEVADTGIGIPSEHIPYLFQKFSRSKESAKIDTGGTGLGLHVGKRIISALGGKIGMESKGEGKGTTFFVELPLVFSGKTEK